MSVCLHPSFSIYKYSWDLTNYSFWVNTYIKNLFSIKLNTKKRLLFNTTDRLSTCLYHEFLSSKYVRTHPLALSKKIIHDYTNVFKAYWFSEKRRNWYILRNIICFILLWSRIKQKQFVEYSSFLVYVLFLLVMLSF